MYCQQTTSRAALCATSRWDPYEPRHRVAASSWSNRDFDKRLNPHFSAGRSVFRALARHSDYFFNESHTLYAAPVMPASAKEIKGIAVAETASFSAGEGAAADLRT
jgi:hypothetical protein